MNIETADNLRASHFNGSHEFRQVNDCPDCAKDGRFCGCNDCLDYNARAVSRATVKVQG